MNDLLMVLRFWISGTYLSVVYRFENDLGISLVLKVFRTLCPDQVYLVGFSVSEIDFIINGWQ
jgi:hypothetical protein